MDMKRFFLYAIAIAALALAGCGRQRRWWGPNDAADDGNADDVPLARGHWDGCSADAANCVSSCLKAEDPLCGCRRRWVCPMRTLLCSWLPSWIWWPPRD